MFARKLIAQVRQHEDSLKGRLVDLYTKLQNGSLSDFERAKLQAAIDDIKAKIATETRRLGAAPHNEEHAL